MFKHGLNNMPKVTQLRHDTTRIYDPICRAGIENGHREGAWGHSRGRRGWDELRK